MFLREAFKDEVKVTCCFGKGHPAKVSEQREHVGDTHTHTLTNTHTLHNIPVLIPI